MKALTLCVLSFISLPCVADAQVVISEIMYDLAEGGDTGREWVEVFNAGASAVTLSDWKLFEAETNHKLTEVQGGVNIPSGGYAIIADNATKFIIDWPEYAGMLLDSTFSLTNSGETLVLRNIDLVDKDTLRYGSDDGGAGDGKSLHRQSAGSTSVQALSPTPGSGLLIASAALASAIDMEDDETHVPAESATTPSVLGYHVEPRIAAYAGKDRVAVVGADMLFEGRVFSASGEPIDAPRARFLWNFGDGSTAEGRTASHGFAHPGKYAVVLDVSEGIDAAAHRITITAEPARLTLGTLADGSVTIHNGTIREIDLSYWHVREGSRHFSFPKNTILFAHGVMTISPRTMLFTATPTVLLLYPNGIVATEVPGITQTQAMSADPMRIMPIQKVSSVIPAVKEMIVPAYDSHVEEVGDEELEDQVAAVTAALPAGKTSRSDFGWFLALGVLLAVGATGAWFTQQEAVEASHGLPGAN